MNSLSPYLITNESSSLSHPASLLETLDDLGLRHGTDKASCDHGYLEFYEQFLSPLRNQPVKVLEIGVLNGASLKTWESYFQAGEIIGADIVPESERFEAGRVRIEIADQSNVEELTRLAMKHGPFDIIIEDGSHMWEHQITTLRTLFPFLKDDGFYIVEDLQTNYGSMREKYQGIASMTCVDYLKTWLDLRVADSQIPVAGIEDAFLRTYGRAVQFMTFYKRACLIKKQFQAVVRVSAAGRAIVPARPSDEPAIAASIIAHVSMKGDVRGDAGFVNPSSEGQHFEGLRIDCAAVPLEYRVRYADGNWSDWCANGGFAGTRGAAKLISGVTVRVAAAAAAKFSVLAHAVFGGAEPVHATNGVDCLSATNEPLRGLQIEILKRPGFSLPVGAYASVTANINGISLIDAWTRPVSVELHARA